jgi:hypothetical protein
MEKDDEGRVMRELLGWGDDLEQLRTTVIDTFGWDVYVEAKARAREAVKQPIQAETFLADLVPAELQSETWMVEPSDFCEALRLELRQLVTPH